MLRREDLEAPLEQLGGAADELASRNVLAGAAEAHRVLEAILLVVPGHERGAPRIGDTLIPDLLPGQWTWIPKAWIGQQLEFAPG